MRNKKKFNHSTHTKRCFLISLFLGKRLIKIQYFLSDIRTCCLPTTFPIFNPNDSFSKANNFNDNTFTKSDNDTNKSPEVDLGVAYIPRNIRMLCVVFFATMSSVSNQDSSISSYNIFSFIMRSPLKINHGVWKSEKLLL